MASTLNTSANQTQQQQQQHEAANVCYEEVPLRLTKFFGMGMLGQLLLPVTAVYCLVVHRKMAFLFAPAGTYFAFMPVLWILAACCIIGAVMIFVTPAWQETFEVRPAPGGAIVSVGEGAVAFSLYLVVVMVCAAATAQTPYEADDVLLHADDENQKTLRKESKTRMKQPQQQEGGDSEMNGVGPTSAVTVDPTTTTTKSPDPTTSSNEGSKRASVSPSLPLAYTDADDALYIPAHIPYDQVLMEEVPPLPSHVWFVYRAERYFSFNGQLAHHINDDELDPLGTNSTSAKKKQHTTAAAAAGAGNATANPLIRSTHSYLDQSEDGGQQPQKNSSEELMAQQHRMSSDSSAPFSPNGARSGSLSISVNAANEPVSLQGLGFEFRIGEIVTRSNYEPNYVIDFGGEVGAVSDGDTVEIIARRYCGNDYGREYRIGQGDGRWHKLTSDHFWVCGEVSISQSADLCVPGADVLQGVMEPNLSDPKRGVRRCSYGNGNYGSYAGKPAPMSVLLRALMYSCAFVLAALPILLRWFTGNYLAGQGSGAEWVVTISSFLLSFMSLCAMMTVLRATMVSFIHQRNVVRNFSIVTMRGEENKWFPVLNWLEPANIQAWYFMRDHLTSVFREAFNARLFVAWITAVFSVLWGLYCSLIAAITSTSGTQIVFDGWLVQALLIGILLSVLAWLACLQSVQINQVLERHVPHLSLSKVDLNEELAAGAPRERHELLALMEVQAMMDDISFALQWKKQQRVAPFGMPMSWFVLRFFFVMHLLLLVPLALVIVSGVNLNERWQLPRSRWV